MGVSVAWSFVMTTSVASGRRTGYRHRRYQDPPPRSGQTGGMDKQELGAFLRSRRERLRPQDVGLPLGPATPDTGPAPRGGRGPRAHLHRVLRPARAGPGAAPVGRGPRRDRRRAAAHRRRVRSPARPGRHRAEPDRTAPPRRPPEHPRAPRAAAADGRVRDVRGVRGARVERPRGRADGGLRRARPARPQPRPPGVPRAGARRRARCTASPTPPSSGSTSSWSSGPTLARYPTTRR